MMNDFNEHWGEEITYSSDVARVSGNRQKVYQNMLIGEHYLIHEQRSKL